MRADLFKKLRYHKDWEIPQPPLKGDFARIYIYSRGVVVAEGDLNDLAADPPEPFKYLKEKLGGRSPQAFLEMVETDGYVVERVFLADDFQNAEVLYERELDEFFDRLYDFLCSTKMLGIIPNPTTKVLFRLALTKVRKTRKVSEDHYFLPEIGLNFYKYCNILQDEMFAAPGGYQDDFYGVQNLLGMGFGYSGRKGFEYGIERFSKDLQRYHPEDHPTIAARFVEAIKKYNAEDGDIRGTVEIPPYITTLAEQNTGEN